MDEILSVYTNFMNNQVIDASICTYNNLNIAIDGKSIHLYDISGTLPCGRYRIPSTEQAFIDFINKMDKKIKELVDNNQYICGKCGGAFDLPEEKKDPNGNLICLKCVSGGDLRIKPDPKKKVEKSESEIPSTTDYLAKKQSLQPKEITVQDAIDLLNKSGTYVVKKIVKSYKAVYTSESGSEGITHEYFKTPEEFRSKNPGLKFVTFIKELNKQDEESI